MKSEVIQDLDDDIVYTIPVRDFLHNVYKLSSISASWQEMSTLNSEDILPQYYTAVISEQNKKTESEKEKLLNLIRENNIKVNNIELLNKLLSKLDEEIELLYNMLEYLINVSKEQNISFSIRVYPSDGDLENLYFAIHFPKESRNNKEYKEKIISELEHYQETIDKQNLLWFVGFTSFVSR